MRQGMRGVLQLSCLVAVTCLLAAATGAAGRSTPARATVAGAPSFGLVSPKGAQDCATGQVVVGRACVQLSGYGAEWTQSDSSATWTHPMINPQWAVTDTWTVPDTIPAAGADVTLSVMGTEMTHDPNASVCPTIGASGGFTFVGAQSVSVCAQNDQNGNGNPGTASKPGTVMLIPPNSQGAITLVIGVQDGPVFTYTYKPLPSTTPPPVAPPPPVVVPTPSGFDQTVTAPEPPPGGTAVITSPVLALAGAVTAPSTVTVDISGLSVRDQVIANARHSCYVNFTKTVFSRLKEMVSDPEGYDKTDPRYNLDYHVEYEIRLLTPELAGCLALVDALQQRLYATTAGIAGASCAVTPFTLLTSVSGTTARLRSVRLGDSHPAVRVSCSRQAGKLTIRVATQSAHTPLSSIVGSRLRIGILRSPKDSPGGQLSVAFHHP